MNFFKRKAAVIANDGTAASLQPLNQEPLSSDGDLESAQALSRIALANEQNRLVHDFNRKARSMGYEDIADYWWYHTIDLGNGLITPGYYDYRHTVSEFGFPEMTGMDVLEVGSATGFFAFEFEKRRANVTSVELPALTDFDLFPGETLEQCVHKFDRILRKTEAGLEPSARHERLYVGRSHEEAYHYFVDGPFRFCHRLLESKVQRLYSTIYELSSNNLGKDHFDIVYLGDVLLHTLYPLKALAAAAAVCRKTLIIAQEMRASENAQPAMAYIGGDELGQDGGAWWLPNQTCIEQILRKLGFRNVTMVGTHAGVVRLTGERFERPIIHATR